MSKAKILRITVGAECDPSVAPWRIWVQGDEIYLGWRSTVQTVKVSLHSRGVWKADFGTKRFNLNGRVRFSDGWDLGPTLSFPNLPVERLPAGCERSGFDTSSTNLALGKINFTRIIQILLSRDSRHLEKIDKPVREKIDWEYTRELRSAGSLLLVSFVRRLTTNELDSITDIKNKTIFWYKDAVPTDSWANLLMFETPLDKNHPSQLITIPVGRENFKVETQKTK